MTALPDIFSELNADQVKLLRVIYGPAREAGCWPNWRWVDGSYSGQTGKDARDVLRSLPIVWPVSSQFQRYGLVKYVEQDPREDTEMRLTVAAALHLPEFRKVGKNFVRILQVLIEQSMYPPRDPFKVEPLVITNVELWEKHRIPINPVLDRLMPDLLWGEPMNFTNGTGRAPGASNWQLTLNREGLRRVQEVKDLRGYVETVVAWVQRIPDHLERAVVVAAPAAAPRLAPLIVPQSNYINKALIGRLEAVQAVAKWNLKKLLQLLLELNENYASENVYACHALLRAILDHVPPVFGQKTFGSVIDQYGWGRTDKKYMKRLEEFRAQADDALHRQIRPREDILDFHDLPPRAWVNRLLDEAVAVLETETSEV
ncbi:hypothetical protein [Amycolatopsis sp. CB00013]|uniref:hypothetical protein n=1 Tax=Amycolatopsis sp. CB00013 TaxID=1703945 RepID=UPI0011613CBD|nr:hypothetical protein [Amycolatopsis sp. CB00013]